MSGRKKKRRESAGMPAQGAGLLRFFEEDTRGVKVRPELAVISYWSNSCKHFSSNYFWLIYFS